jgi:hypothetical protein
MAKQTLKQALHLVDTGKMRVTSLVGLPAGGWGDTQQALRQLREDLPLRSERSYTIDEFVSARYELDHADRYRVRAPVPR